MSNGTKGLALKNNSSCILKGILVTQLALVHVQYPVAFSSSHCAEEDEGNSLKEFPKEKDNIFNDFLTSDILLQV